MMALLDKPESPAVQNLLQEIAHALSRGLFCV